MTGTSASNARRVYAASNVVVDAVRAMEAEMAALEAENAEYRAALLDSGTKLGDAVAEILRLRALLPPGVT